MKKTESGGADRSGAPGAEVIDHGTVDARRTAERLNVLVDRHAPAVWSVVQQAELPAEVASEVNLLTWLRLADHIAEVDPDGVPGWLLRTAIREATRARKLLNVAGPPAAPDLPRRGVLPRTG